MAEQLGEAVLTVSADTRQLQAGLDRARQQAEQNGEKIKNAFDGVGNTLRNLATVAGVVGIGALTQQIIQTGQESERSKIQLTALAGAYGEAAQAAAAASRIQKILGVSSLEARQNFAQLYAALRGTGIGLNQLEVLFVGLSKAAQLSGASTAEASGALLQLRQGLASGVLQGDELRSVLENLPAFAQAVAKEMGVNVGQLRKLGSEGKITSAIVFNAAKSLASATTPGKTNVEELGVAFTNLREQIAAAVGPSLVSILRNTAAGFAVMAKFIETNKEPLKAVVQSVVGMTKAVLPLIIGIQAVRGAMAAWALASRAVAVAQAAVLSLSGPAGIAAVLAGLGVAALAAKGLEAALKGIGEAGKGASAEAKQAIDDFNKALGGTKLEPSTAGQAPTPATLAAQQLANNLSELQLKNLQERLAVTKLLGQQDELGALKLQNRLALNEKIRASQADQLNLDKELAKPRGLGDGASNTQNLKTIADLQGKIRSSQIEIATQRIENQQAEEAAFRRQREQQQTLALELRALQQGPDAVVSPTALLKIKLANMDVREAYASAGKSLVDNARSAATALQSAQQGFDSTARGGFQFLTAGLQQEQLRNARASVQTAVDKGLIRTGIDISSPEKLFQVASFAEQIVPAQKQLENALAENTKATVELTKKDWNVYLGGKPITAPKVPTVSQEPVTFGPQRNPAASAYGVWQSY